MRYHRSTFFHKEAAMSEKSKLDTKKDVVPENFFVASKSDGRQRTFYYSQAACAVLDECKKRRNGTTNQFISDAIVEYGMAQFGEELGEVFSKRKLKCFSKPKNRVPKEVVIALALALLDEKTFKQDFAALCNSITAEDLAELEGSTAKTICSTLAEKHNLCDAFPEKPLWALAFWAVQKGWFKKDGKNTTK